MDLSGLIDGAYFQYTIKEYGLFIFWSFISFFYLNLIIAELYA